jgi:hypothetical protein
MSDVDTTTPATKPFDPGPEHHRLLAMVGAWQGPTETWFDADAEAELSTTRAHAVALLGGRFVRISYESTAMGSPHAGEMTLGFSRDEKLWTMAWIDSFHTGTATMFFTGSEAISVLGSYAAGAERWGWRTTFELANDTLTIAAFNIPPGRKEERALRTVLRR